MCDMKVQQMHLADSAEWCTVTYAAQMLGLSVRTVTRLIASERLPAYLPMLGTGEDDRHKTMLRVADVRRYRSALDVIRPSDATPVRQG
jgi:excisionase family DNA binding protein